MERTKDKKAISKRLDTDLPREVKRRSRVSEYWFDEKFREMWKAFRPGFSKILPKTDNPFNQKSVIDKFNLKGFEYGNWLNQEDRYNYFLACQIALYDLQGILKFGYNLGINGVIGVAFGARGHSSALAHFEPDTFMINITRYTEAKKYINWLSGRPVFGDKTTYEVKDKLFQITGGIGSLGHEYGHALDYFFGSFVDQDTRYKLYRSLTQGSSVSTKPDIDYRKDSLRYDANMIIHKMIWENENKFTAFYQTLVEGVAKKEISKYWIQHNELFARAFEVYLSYKLKQQNIENLFLVKNKYENKWPYPQGKVLKAIIPHFDSLISKMRKKIK